MPAQPAWFHRLDEILADLRSMTSTHLDRAAVEKLFRVRQRRARQIMAGLEGLRVGNPAAPSASVISASSTCCTASCTNRFSKSPSSPIRASIPPDFALRLLAGLLRWYCEASLYALWGPLRSLCCVRRFAGPSFDW